MAGLSLIFCFQSTIPEVRAFKAQQLTFENFNEGNENRIKYFNPLIRASKFGFFLKCRSIQTCKRNGI